MPPPFALPRKDEPESRRATVLMMWAGGLEHGGGIGRQIGYFLDAASAVPQAPDYRVIDTRGPWFLGAARGRLLHSVGYLLRASATLIGYARSGPPVLLHVNITGRGSTFRKLLLTAIAQGCGLPYLLHVHDYDYAGFHRSQSKKLRWAARRMFARSQLVIVLGDHAAGELREALALPVRQVSVMRNAVPDPGIVPLRANRSAPPHILFLGHLSERKGVSDLLQALAQPAMQATPWHATIAGGGPVEHYRAMAAGLGLSGRVAIPGWVDLAGVAALCSAADILALPSYAEGLAMSLLEGLSHGLAVIATPVGAHSEVIEPGVSGVFVQPGDVAGLASALCRLVEDPATRANLQRGARLRFREAFDIGPYAARLAALHSAELHASQEWQLKHV